MKEKIQRQGKKAKANKTNYYSQKSDYKKRKGLQGWRGFVKGNCSIEMYILKSVELLPVT